MGSLDSNGVWIYSNDDQMVPHATYMNLGQQSVSDALGDLRSDLTFPTLPRATAYQGGQQAVTVGSFGNLGNPVSASITLPQSAVVQYTVYGLFGVGGGSVNDVGGLGVNFTGSYTEAPTTLARVLRGSNFPINGGAFVRTLIIPAGTLNAQVQGYCDNAAVRVRGVGLELVALRWN